jgi:type II secretory pathway predicted ATPase ExeA/phage tail protein X
VPPIECATDATGEAVFLEYYGMHRQPFGVTPDPSCLYLSPSHREALASLIYEIESKRGFSALVAEPGMGKTSLLFHLLETVKSSARTAFLFQLDCDSRGLLRNLLADLGIDASDEEIPQMQGTLNEVLLEESRSGRHFLLVIDEAQDLNETVLETIRLLSNFETPTAKLMHIVLAGQPQLADKLARPELAQLRQRIANIISLNPLSRQETVEYIEHRLRRAGYPRQPLFTTRAKATIAVASQGVPRNINNICFLSLSLGFAHQCRRIDENIVQEALADFVAENPVDHEPPEASRYEPMAALPRYVEVSEQPHTRFLLWTTIGILGLVTVPLFLILPTGSRLGASGSVAAQIGKRITSSFTSHQYDLPDLPLSQPAALQPPQPPALAQEKSPLAQKEKDAETNLEPEEDHLAPSDPRQIRSRPKHRVSAKTAPGPRIVHAQRPETLFQLAVEYYGRSNWIIIGHIRRNNPEIRDSFSVLREGQRIILPDLSPQYPWKTADTLPAKAGRP